MVVKTKLIYLCILVNILLLFNVFAQNLPLTFLRNKEVYSPGDIILIYTNIYNVNSNPVKVTLESLLTNKKGTYPLGVIPFEFDLGSKETKKVLLYNISIDKNFVSDTYNIEVTLLFDGRKLTKEMLEFEVKNTLKEIMLDIHFCKDKQCSEKSKIFLKNENIYLDFNSEVQNPTITTTLTYPNKKQEQITLPYSFKPSQTGTYNLEVTASKQGYKTITKKEQFGVIEKEAEIKSVSVCNSNNICDSPKENIQNCPQDCKKLETKTIEKKKKSILYTWWFWLTLLILIIIFWLILRKKEEKHINIKQS